ncbi:MAG: hypothetical protein KJ638_12820, partial [Chloroflexi bacterium]|nr:hypothetical protein [Chloroflexota bacterium]
MFHKTHSPILSVASQWQTANGAKSASMAFAAVLMLLASLCADLQKWAAASKQPETASKPRKPTIARIEPPPQTPRKMPTWLWIALAAAGVIVFGLSAWFIGSKLIAQPTSDPVAVIASLTPSLTSEPLQVLPSSTNTEMPSPTVTKSTTPLPTPSPTRTPTQTPKPVLRLPVSAGTAIPISDLMINPKNKDRVILLARWGKGTVYGLAWSSDGNFLAVASSIGVYLYDSRTLQEIRFIETQHRVDRVTFSPDGSILASGNSDAIKLWQVSDGVLLNTLDHKDHHFNSMAFSPDGSILASGSDD